MLPYRFETKITDNRIIHLPSDYKSEDEEVEVLILNKRNNNPKNAKAVAFINKWAGTLKNEINETSDLRIKYLIEKYK